MKNYVYWIYDDTCLDMTKDGYIGVSYNPDMRFKAHKRKNSRISQESKMKIIYEGTREECFNLEYELRPSAGIGWNLAIGGSHGWKLSFNHSNESKQKMKMAWSNHRKAEASKFRAEQNKKLKGQKRPSQSESIKGEKNGMYGKRHTIESRKKISLAHSGKTPSNKLEYYCIYCRVRSSESILKKYHGIGKKNCNNDKLG